MTSEEFVEATGIPYHTLDHWVNCGHLVVGVPNPGSGQKRSWSDGEVVVARVMVVLVGCGVEPAAASRAARNGGWLADGVRVFVEREGVRLP